MKKFLDELSKIAGSERRAVYGEPAEHFARSAKIKEALRAAVRPVDPELDHVLDMIADKLARLAQSPSHEDSWLDVAGYAMNAYEILDKRKECQKARAVKFEYKPHPPGSWENGNVAQGPAHGQVDACKDVSFMYGVDLMGNPIFIREKAGKND